MPKLKACSARFRKAVAAGDRAVMERESDLALSLMTSIIDLLRNEQDAKRLDSYLMNTPSGLLIKNATSAERLTMIQSARLDRSHSHCNELSLREALNKIAHCDAAHSTYRIDGRGAHYIILSGPDQNEKKGPWVAEILISKLCRNANAAMKGLST